MHDEESETDMSYCHENKALGLQNNIALFTDYEFIMECVTRKFKVKPT